MFIDLAKLNESSALTRHPAAGEMHRHGDVLYLGAGLAAGDVLETIFDSDCLAPISIFFFSFDSDAAYFKTEDLVSRIKKNFKGYLLGKFSFAPALHLIERAYAAGIDLADIPFPADNAGSSNTAWETLRHAREIFPRWSVIATLAAKEGDSLTAATLIDELLREGIVPLPIIPHPTEKGSYREFVGILEHTVRMWHRQKVILQPLLPYLKVVLPLAEPRRKGRVGDFLDKAMEARLRTVSDLRRRLRVKQVEESFESAGL